MMNSAVVSRLVTYPTVCGTSLNTPQNTQLADLTGTFKVLGGTGRFNNASGQGDFMMTSTLNEVVVTIPQGGVTGNFTGKVEWPELKVTTK